MKNEQLYREAIAIAAEKDAAFLEKFEANQQFNYSQELKEMHHRIEVVPAASAACAQSELIARLFGVSEEKVSEDIAAYHRAH